ncbi:MAG: hypothetical protein CMH03_10585 [Marinovum sp.]|nr:hypothetical protein [Marinovum sp.]|tara:strand:- start:1724 stop:1915 length:192 start_codon:yes stop_codon:yes gene_type:complete
MNIGEEIDWILVDGGNGLDVLWFLLKNEPFLQVLIGFALVMIVFCYLLDNKDTKWDGDPHSKL